MTVATMTLRAARQRNVVLAVIGASMLVSLLLLSQTHSRLRRTEDDFEKCQQKHDSVSAQLTVLYEHKARLEKTLQAEIERKKSVDDKLKTCQAALSKEKAVQAEKFAKLQRENEELKQNHKDEYVKLKDTYESLKNDKEKLDLENEELNLQMQKLRESNHKLEEEVRKMQQSEPIDFNEVERLRERVRQCDDADRTNHRNSQQIAGQVAAPGLDHAGGDERVLPPPIEASSRRPISSTHSRRIRPNFIPSPIAHPRESLVAPIIQKFALSNEIGHQGPQVVGESPLGADQRGNSLMDLTANANHRGVLALPRFIAGHDADSRFYAVPANVANLEQLRSKHGVRTFY